MDERTFIYNGGVYFVQYEIDAGEDDIEITTGRIHYNGPEDREYRLPIRLHEDSDEAEKVATAFIEDEEVRKALRIEWSEWDQSMKDEEADRKREDMRYD